MIPITDLRFPAGLLQRDLREGEPALADLEAEWWELWGRTPGATPFQSPAWLLPWWRHLGRGRLLTLAWRAEGRLVGLAAFTLSASPGLPLRRLPLRRLRLLGCGHSDYLDLLVAPGWEAPVLASLAEWLDQGEGWDCCDFRHLRPESPLLLRPELGSGSVQETCPYLPLPPCDESWEDTLPRGLREGLRYSRRRLARESGLELLSVREVGLQPCLERFFQLHARRWRSRGLPGSFAGERVRRFHREAAEALEARGLLRLYLLRIGGRDAAAFYGFQSGDRLYYYAGGLEPELGKHGPGNLLIAHAAREAVREGARELDFLRGDESYKYRWGARDRFSYRLLRARPGVRGKASLLLTGAEERLYRQVVRWARSYSASGNRKRVQLSQ
ncbi:MAG: GNAT family N-acetyltransferase [Armatimonadota bacterium]